MKHVSELFKPVTRAQKSYQEKLKDPRWIERRRSVVAGAGGICQSCKRKGPIDVHHNFYDKDRDPWDYSDGELRPLCRECHESIHGLMQSFRAHVVPLMDAGSLKILLGALSVGLKFHRPLFVAAAVGTLVSDEKEIMRLASAFKSK